MYRVITLKMLPFKPRVASLLSIEIFNLHTTIISHINYYDFESAGGSKWHVRDFFCYIVPRVYFVNILYFSVFFWLTTSTKINVPRPLSTYCPLTHATSIVYSKLSIIRLMIWIFIFLLHLPKILFTSRVDWERMPIGIRSASSLCNS